MKSCYSILCDVNELASGHQNVHFCCAKVNCRLHWNDKQEDIFEKPDDSRDLPDRNYQTFLFIDYILNYFLFNLLVTQNQYQYLFQRIGFQRIFSGDRWKNPIGDSSLARLQAEHGPGTLLRPLQVSGILVTHTAQLKCGRAFCGAIGSSWRLLPLAPFFNNK